MAPNRPRRMNRSSHEDVELCDVSVRRVSNLHRCRYIGIKMYTTFRRWTGVSAFGRRRMRMDARDSAITLL